MALLVNIRHLEKHPLALADQVAAADLDLESKDDLIRFAEPVSYELQIQKVDQALLVQGVVSVAVECDCSRCLKAFSTRIVIENWTVHLPLMGESAAPQEGDCVDLTPFMREDILLALPQHPLCSTDCQGLLRKYDREATPPSDPGKGDAKPSPWGELDKLDL